MTLFPILWVALAAVFLALEAAGRLRIGGLEPLGGFLGGIRRRRIGRSALWIVWMWLGWHFFAR